MKFASLTLAAAALAGSAFLPMAASAQALDATTGQQAVVELANDVRHAQAFSVLFASHGPMGADACEPIDPAVQQQAILELNDLDQRATDLAYRTSGTVHAQAMTIVRTLETRQLNLLYPIVSDSCYVAPGASQQQQQGALQSGPAPTPQKPYLDTDTSWTGSAGWR